MITEQRIYIHYGADSYDPEKVDIHNSPWRNKPKGGFWGTPEDSIINWKDWCLSQKLRMESLKRSFRFRLKEGTRVYYVNSEEKEEALPLQKIDGATILKGINNYQPIAKRIYDFEALNKEGYDAVEISISECPNLLKSMFGWDCDSIVIMNPDVVEVL